MDRREFLGTAVMLAFLPSHLEGKDEPLIIDIKNALRHELIVLLGHREYSFRESAMLELLERGVDEIQETQAVLKWKNELFPPKGVLPEATKRLEKLRQAFTVEEAKLLWNGMRIPEMIENYSPTPVPLLEYGAKLNEAMGGVLWLRQSYENTTKPLTVHPGRSGEPLWEWVARNKEYFSVIDEKKVLDVQEKPENKFLAHDGALFGKLDIEGKGGLLYLMTDPGLTIKTCEPLAIEATINGKVVALPFKPGPTISSTIFAEYPPGTQWQDVEMYRIHVRIWASPIIAASVTDFAKDTTHNLGAYTGRCLSVSSFTDDNEQQWHSLHCLIRSHTPTETRSMVNLPDQYFTTYYQTPEGKLAIQYAKTGSPYVEMDDAGEFLLLLPHTPHRLDMHMPHEDMVLSMERTLTFDMKKK